MKRENSEKDYNNLDSYKYFAFISYNAKDVEWGKRVQRKLEHYRMPATLCSQMGWKRTPINPVFFAPTDIQPGGLSSEIQERLRASKNLIVICTPSSARSEWVGREIEFFHKNLGRTNHIFFFIVEGQPHSNNSSTECFNPIVQKIGLPEILAANIHEKIYRSAWLNKERAYVQLISKLLGIEFDAIWKRHKRLLHRKIFFYVLAILVFIAALTITWIANQPVDVAIILNEAAPINKNLPKPELISLTLLLDNELKSTTVPLISSQAVFKNIPRQKLNQNVHIKAFCKGFLPVDTMMTLERDMNIVLRRDELFYGNLRFVVWSEENDRALPHIQLKIDGILVETDDNGYAQILIPLEKQRTHYQIESNLKLDRNLLNARCTEETAVFVTE